MPSSTRSGDLLRQASRSSRSRGAVGKDPRCYRYLRECLVDSSKWMFIKKPDFSTMDVLDFGAGKGAPHAQGLRNAGFRSVVAYDLPANMGTEHDPEALAQLYDLVIASNVLNVQGTREMLMQTLRQIQSSTREYGFVVCNYPADPRYAGLSNDEVFKALAEVFRTVQIVSGKLTNKQPIMFLCVHH